MGKQPLAPLRGNPPLTAPGRREERVNAIDITEQRRGGKLALTTVELSNFLEGEEGET